MSIALKSEHIQRYRQIVRLLYRYGRRDALRRAGLEDPGAEEATPTHAESSSVPKVHAAPGEILRRQREDEASNGHGDAVPNHGDVDEAHALAQRLAYDLEAMGPTFSKLGQFLSTHSDMLPANYVEALSRLQDRVGPISFLEVER